MITKQKIINLLKKNNKLFFIVKALRILQAASFSKIDGSKKKYPKVMQLPITYKCNSRCVMCNIWKMDNSNEMSIKEFANFINDPIFKKITSVGVNGGEPSLLRDLPKYVDEILKLPSLTALNIISHGFNTERLLRSVEAIYSSCKAKNISFHVSISLDGFKGVHDDVRQIPDGFDKTTTTIDEIIKNQDKYCDSYDLGCTVVNQNIDYLMELDVYAKSKNYNIKYRLGIDNKRIESDKIRGQYSVIYSPLKQSAKEFFFYQMTISRDIGDKFKYYAIFAWLNSSNPKRMLGCSWKDEGITLDARGELYYCAVASKSIGTLRDGDGEDIFFNDDNINYRKSIINNSCDGCIHDYSGRVEFKNIWSFLKEIINTKLSMRLYRIKARLM